MRLYAILSFFLIFLTTGINAENFKYKRWSKFTYHKNPSKADKKIFIYNDINGDGKPEILYQYRDLHNGEDAEFRISTVNIKKRTAEIISHNIKLKTSDDYCKSIKLKDLDDDGIYEIIFSTVNKYNENEMIYIVKYDKKHKSYNYLKPDKPIGYISSSFSFKSKNMDNLAELHVISAKKNADTIFKKVSKIKKTKPKFWIKQIYFIKKNKLEHFETTMINTPYYILNKFLKALKKQKTFSAYRHIFSKVPYYKFKKNAHKKYRYIYSKNINGDFYLNNWYTDYYRKIRNFGWLTFSYVFKYKRKKYNLMYQVFMKKVYDEWKITLMKIIRFRRK